MFKPRLTRILTDDVDITLPPTWFSYQWAHDPVPDRHWCWDTFLACQIQEALELTEPELYRQLVTTYPIEYFIEPLAGNVVNPEYARSLSPERLEVPILGVCLPEPISDGGSPVGVVIDGCHRLFRRHELGLKTVDVLQLPDFIEEQIRFSPEQVQTLKKLGLL